MKMFNRLLLVFSLLGTTQAAVRAEAPSAEPPFERGADKIRLELLAARGGFCALSVAAHPDDEDGATLAWLRRVGGVEVHMCLATRGEGGQNESGPELGEALAWKRTQETEAAARLLGAKVWYLNLPDFGYSKSAEETLKVWNQEEALGRLVRVIRAVKPDVIFTSHDPAGKDHGHHVAIARLLDKAFEAAADEKRFPEQISTEGLRPWAARKLYRRLWDEGKTAATLTFNVSERDPNSGSTPVEVAAWALAKHVSQGMQREVRAGDRVERHFLLVQSRLGEIKKEPSMLDGFELLDGDPWTQTMDELGAEAPRLAHSLVGLVYSTQRFHVIDDAHFEARLNRFTDHAHRAAAEALGLRVEARVEDPIVALGEDTKVTIRLANTGPLPVRIEHWNLAAEPGWELGALEAPKDPVEPGRYMEVVTKVKATTKAYPNFPPERYLDARAEQRAPVAVEIQVRAGFGQNEAAFPLPRSPVPLSLAPDFEARFTQDPVLIFDDPDRADQETVWCRGRLVVTNHRQAPWTLCMKLLPDPRMQTVETGPRAGVKLEFTAAEETRTAEVSFSATVGELGKGDLLARTLLYSEREQFPSWSPVARFRRVPLKLPALLNVGLVRTYDRSTWEALRRLAASFPGLGLMDLAPDELLEGDLDGLHTILLDLRATQYRPDVLQHRERLKAFMERGGHVVCFYHKDFDWNPPQEEARGRGFFRGQGGGGAVAPYPLTLSFERVTDEKAPVRLLLRDHALLSRPCKIWEKDFAGWVQERGVYFPSAWDPKYQALLACHDEGGQPLDGGLLSAPVGKGSFVYTSYVWYRQLRAGVPGAYRMLANLLAYPRVKEAAENRNP